MSVDLVYEIGCECPGCVREGPRVATYLVLMGEKAFPFCSAQCALTWWGEAREDMILRVSRTWDFEESCWWCGGSVPVSADD